MKKKSLVYNLPLILKYCILKKDRINKHWFIWLIMCLSLKLLITTHFVVLSIKLLTKNHNLKFNSNQSHFLVIKSYLHFNIMLTLITFRHQIIFFFSGRGSLMMLRIKYHELLVKNMCRNQHGTCLGPVEMSHKSLCKWMSWI